MFISFLMGLVLLIPPAPIPTDTAPVVRIEHDNETIHTNDFFFFTPVVKDIDVKWSAEGPKGPLKTLNMDDKAVQVMTGSHPGKMQIFAELNLTRRYRIYYNHISFDCDVPIKLKLIIHEAEIKPYNPPLFK